MKNETEKEVQEKTVAYARKNGILCYKWAIAGHYGTKGVPDYIFVYNSEVIPVEFKSTSGKLTGVQKKCHEELGRAGVSVAVINSVEEGRGFINYITSAGAKNDLSQA